MSRRVGMPTQVTDALQKQLGDEEKLLAEVQRDKDRFDQRQALEGQVRDSQDAQAQGLVCS